MASSLEWLICDTQSEADRVSAAIHRLFHLVDARPFPYSTPLHSGDRVGPDDGSVVVVQRHHGTLTLTTGKVGVPVTAAIRRLLQELQARGYTAADLGLTAAQRTRLLTLWQGRRQLTDDEPPQVTAP